jgi:hypothetical protein
MLVRKFSEDLKKNNKKKSKEEIEFQLDPAENTG